MYGQAMNFREDDFPVDIDVLPGELGNGKSEGQSLLVMTTRGFGKRVDTDEFKLTRRSGGGRGRGTRTFPRGRLLHLEGSQEAGRSSPVRDIDPSL